MKYLPVVRHDFLNDCLQVLFHITSSHTHEDIIPISISKLRETNWELFRDILNENIRLDHRMKENEEIEEVIQHLTQNIQDTSWKATPSIHKMKQEKQNTPLHIIQLISEK
jgi:hypothetical protein